MDRLWAPWRIGYVSNADKEATCFLCAAAEDDPANDRQRLVVARGRHVFAILNRFPYNNGHVMVAPYAHKADLPELTEEERSEMMQMLIEVQAALKAAFYPHGFNIGINLGASAGAGVPGHMHVHILPRWTGDTNFVSTVAETKVISQSLDEAWCALVRHFEGKTAPDECS
jgi:ATP adenylyltransferase